MSKSENPQSISPDTCARNHIKTLSIDGETNNNAGKQALILPDPVVFASSRSIYAFVDEGMEKGGCRSEQIHIPTQFYAFG
jgi:hypothetical protein